MKAKLSKMKKKGADPEQQVEQQVYKKPEKKHKPWEMSYKTQEYQSVEDMIFKNPKNLSIEKDRILMKFNIKPKEQRNWLQSNELGYFDIYANTRTRNNLEAHNVVKKFLSETLSVKKENLVFETEVSWFLQRRVLQIF